jgi:hypothetical protein
MMHKYNTTRQGESWPTYEPTSNSNKRKRYPIDQKATYRAPFTDPHTFKLACLDVHRPMDPYFLLSLYAEQDQIQALASGIIKKWVTKKDGQRVQKEFRELQWQDTYILAHHLPAYEAYGCKIDRILGTITQAPPQPTDIPPLLLQCISPDTPLLRIRWKTTEDKEKNWRHNFPTQVEGLLKTWDHTQQTLAEESQPSLGHQLNNKQLPFRLQQGLTELTPACYPMYATIKDKVTIHTDPVNPDRDTMGTGHYEMY